VSPESHRRSLVLSLLLRRLRQRLDESESKKAILHAQYERYRAALDLGQSLLSQEEKRKRCRLVLKGLDFAAAQAGKIVKFLAILFDMTDTRVTEGGHTITVKLAGPTEVFGEVRSRKGGGGSFCIADQAHSFCWKCLYFPFSLFVFFSVRPPPNTFSSSLVSFLFLSLLALEH
jgi:hypothetical protein